MLLNRLSSDDVKKYLESIVIILRKDTSLCKPILSACEYFLLDMSYSSYTLGRVLPAISRGFNNYNEEERKKCLEFLRIYLPIDNDKIIEILRKDYKQFYNYGTIYHSLLSQVLLYEEYNPKKLFETECPCTNEELSELILSEIIPIYIKDSSAEEIDLYETFYNIDSNYTCMVGCKDFNDYLCSGFSAQYVFGVFHTVFESRLLFDSLYNYGTNDVELLKIYYPWKINSYDTMLQSIFTSLYSHYDKPNRKFMISIKHLKISFQHGNTFINWLKTHPNIISIEISAESGETFFSDIYYPLLKSIPKTITSIIVYDLTLQHITTLFGLVSRRYKSNSPITGIGLINCSLNKFFTNKNSQNSNRFSISSLFENYSYGLEWLDLKRNSLSDENAASIINSLYNNTSLTSLDLSYNNIKGGESIISELTKPTSKIISRSSISHLSSIDSMSSFTDILSPSDLLSPSPILNNINEDYNESMLLSLKEIILSHNNISLEMVTSLLACISDVDTALQHIDLCNNKIKFNNTIKDYSIKHPFMVSLLKILSNNSSIISFDIRGNPIVFSPFYEEMTNSLMKNKSENLCFFISDDYYEKWDKILTKRRVKRRRTITQSISPLPDISYICDESFPENVDILLLLSSPLDNQYQLKIEQEKTAIIDAVRNSNCDIHLKIEYGNSYLPSFQAYPTPIFHYAGHTNEDKESLILEDNYGRTKLLSANDFIEYCASGRNKPKLIYLNACDSVKLVEKLQQNIHHIISVNPDYHQPISDRICVHFAHIFYLSLFRGFSVKQSFDFACVEINLYSDVNGKAPPFKLLQKDNKDEVLFHSLERVKHIVSGYNKIIPPLPDFYVGRSKTLSDVLCNILSKSDGFRLPTLTVIYGKNGIGKATFSLSLLHYLEAREILVDAHLSIYVSLENINENQDRLSLINKTIKRTLYLSMKSESEIDYIHYIKKCRINILFVLVHMDKFNDDRNQTLIYQLKQLYPKSQFIISTVDNKLATLNQCSIELKRLAIEHIKSIIRKTMESITHLYVHRSTVEDFCNKHYPNKNYPDSLSIFIYIIATIIQDVYKFKF